MKILVSIVVIPDEDSENWKETSKYFRQDVVISNIEARSIRSSVKPQWLAKVLDEPVKNVITAAKMFIEEILL